MKKVTRMQRSGRAKERMYSSEHFQLLVKDAEKAALDGTRRMDLRERQYRSDK